MNVMFSDFSYESEASDSPECRTTLALEIISYEFNNYEFHITDNNHCQIKLIPSVQEVLLLQGENFQDHLHCENYHEHLWTRNRFNEPEPQEE